MNYKHITVEPLTPAIGADIHGVDISKQLSAEVVAEIRAAYLEHLVVFFHDQTLTPAQLVTFSKRFGEKPSSFLVLKRLIETPYLVHI